MRATLQYVKSNAQRRRTVYHASRPVVVVGGDPSPSAKEYIELLAATRRWFWYPITPVAKPRMTRRDKWQHRPCVARYRAFKDCCRDAQVALPDAGGTVIFCLPAPKSFSAKSRAQLDGTEHGKTPDIDNLLKAVMDATREHDSGISGISAHKIWSTVPGFAVIWPQPALDAKAAREVC